MSEDLTEVEVDMEIQRMKIDMERRKEWFVCDIQGVKVFIPDTRKAYWDDVFDVSKFQCHEPDSDLIVSAWPLKYIDNYRLVREFTREMRYGDADRSVVSFHAGVIQSGKVIPHRKEED